MADDVDELALEVRDLFETEVGEDVARVLVPALAISETNTDQMHTTQSIISQLAVPTQSIGIHAMEFEPCTQLRVDQTIIIVMWV